MSDVLEVIQRIAEKLFLIQSTPVPSFIGCGYKAEWYDDINGADNCGLT